MRRPWNQIAVGSCVALSMVTVVAYGLSAFWSVTYGHESWGVRLGRGNVLAKRLPYTPGYGLPVANGLAVDRALHPGVELDWPEWRGDAAYFHGRLPLWMPLLLFPTLAAAFWQFGSRAWVPGYCGSCGYNLTGNKSGVCSECGAKVQPAPAAG